MKKDQHAFERFYREHFTRIYRFVYFRVEDAEVAQDLVSDVFLRAFAHFDGYDPAVSKSAWIYTIARNRLANHYRDRRPGIPLEDVEPFLQDMGADPSQTGELRAALARLSSEERRIVTMKYLEGYTYPEMAQLLGKHANTLKVAAHRALKRLSKLMNPPRL